MAYGAKQKDKGLVSAIEPGYLKNKFEYRYHCEERRLFFWAYHNIKELNEIENPDMALDSISQLKPYIQVGDEFVECYATVQLLVICRKIKNNQPSEEVYSFLSSVRDDSYNSEFRKGVESFFDNNKGYIAEKITEELDTLFSRYQEKLLLRLESIEDDILEDVVLDPELASSILSSFTKSNPYGKAVDEETCEEEDLIESDSPKSEEITPDTSRRSEKRRLNEEHDSGVEESVSDTDWISKSRSKRMDWDNSDENEKFIQCIRKESGKRFNWDDFVKKYKFDRTGEQCKNHYKHLIRKNPSLFSE